MIMMMLTCILHIQEKDKSLFELKKKVDELSKYAAEARKLRYENGVSFRN
jgi:hypothetical protein